MQEEALVRWRGSAVERPSLQNRVQNQPLFFISYTVSGISLQQQSGLRWAVSEERRGCRGRTQGTGVILEPTCPRPHLIPLTFSLLSCSCLTCFGRGQKPRRLCVKPGRGSCAVGLQPRPRGREPISALEAARASPGPKAWSEGEHALSQPWPPGQSGHLLPGSRHPEDKRASCLGMGSTGGAQERRQQTPCSPAAPGRCGSLAGPSGAARPHTGTRSRAREPLGRPAGCGRDLPDAVR